MTVLEIAPRAGLTGPDPASSPTAWPSMSWRSHADATLAPITHATAPGRDRSLCGVPTPVRGEAWPCGDEEWPAARTRCPACAQVVYCPDRA